VLSVLDRGPQHCRAALLAEGDKARRRRVRRACLGAATDRYWPHWLAVAILPPQRLKAVPAVPAAASRTVRYVLLVLVLAPKLVLDSAAHLAAAPDAAAVGRRVSPGPVAADEALLAREARRMLAAPRPVAAAGLHREWVDGRDLRHWAVDWLNSPPTPRNHVRRSPRMARERLAATRRCAWLQISTGLPMIFQRFLRRSARGMGTNYGEITPRDERSGMHWCRQSRMNSTAPHQ
jgi:hypothetical protein